MVDDLFRSRLGRALAWTKSIFPTKTGIVIVVVTAATKEMPLEVSYTSDLPRDTTLLLLKDVVAQLELAIGDV